MAIADGHSMGRAPQCPLGSWQRHLQFGLLCWGYMQLVQAKNYQFSPGLCISMRASDHPAPKTVRGNQAPENNRALHSSRHQAPAGSKLATQSSNWLAAGVALFFLYTSWFLLKPLHCHDACFALKASPTHPTGLSSSSRAFKVRCLQWAVVPIQTKMARIKPN